MFFNHLSNEAVPAGVLNSFEIQACDEMVQMDRDMCSFGDHIKGKDQFADMKMWITDIIVDFFSHNFKKIEGDLLSLYALKLTQPHAAEPHWRNVTFEMHTATHNALRDLTAVVAATRKHFIDVAQKQIASLLSSGNTTEIYYNLEQDFKYLEAISSASIKSIYNASQTMLTKVSDWIKGIISASLQSTIRDSKPAGRFRDEL